MSLGKQFLKAAITEGQAVHLTRLGESFFLEPERAAYRFVKDHHQRYHTLPSFQTLAQNGINLENIPVTEPITYYADKIRRRSAYNGVNSRLEALGSALAAKDMDTVAELLRDMAVEVSKSGSQHNSTTLAEEAEKVIADYEFARRNPGLRGITLGYETLNESTLGAQPGDLIVFAARPGLGKTYIILMLAYHAWRAGHRVLFTSMEMPKLQIASRIVGIESGLDPNRVRAGRLSSDYGTPELYAAVERIKESAGRMHLEAGDFNGKVAGVEEMIVQFQPEIAFVDAAYLLSPEGRKQGGVSRWEMIAEVVQQLKRLALRYEIPIVITVQFNRNQKDKAAKDKETDTSDIGGSDTIAQDASLIYGVLRAPAPFENTRRRIKGIKSREGELVEMLINYRFAPVDLSEIPLSDETQTTAQLMQHDSNWSL